LILLRLAGVGYTGNLLPDLVIRYANVE